MPKIVRLSPELANQIAAGEVVERPASVVKELVENAIDAGARRVSVAVEMGGKRVIRVEDDGEGMAPDDARLALERHATSKIRRAEDLAAIDTLGFRGEALPSIASVSRLVIKTRARGAVTGVEIRVEAGTLVDEREAGAAEGTVIEVADLFFNLPARRKFLKSDVAETTQISRVMTQFALGYPEIGFTLTSGGRRLLQCPPATTFADRFFQLYGERPDLVPVARQGAGLHVSGYVAALAETGPVRGPQNVFVNRRIVRDRTIAHAIQAAYAAATIKERSPEVHLFLDIPPARVDVNVHPTKAEVRFLEQSVVHEVLRRAVADALGAAAVPPPELRLEPALAGEPEARGRTLPGVFTSGPGGWLPPRSEYWQDASDTTRLREVGTERELDDSGAGPVTSLGQQAAVDAIKPMIPLGQFRDTYIIAVDADGIAIVDQHVAHERVLYEQVLEQLARDRVPGQRLLTPVVIELPAGPREALLAHSDELERLGYEVGEFGGGSVRVSAVPALLGTSEATVAVRALADDLEGLDRASRVEDALKRIAATTACHAAVKANFRLAPEKMRYILDELRRTAYSSVCPHGRPVVLRITRREVEKNFQRI